MTSTFLVEVDTEGSTDFIGIAADIQDSLDRQFPMRVVSVKPWARQATTPTALGAAFTPPPSAPL